MMLSFGIAVVLGALALGRASRGTGPTTSATAAASSEAVPTAPATAAAAVRGKATPTMLAAAAVGVGCDVWWQDYAPRAATSAATPTTPEVEPFRSVRYVMSMTEDELRVLLRSRGLQTGGSKQCLGERLARKVAAKADQVEFLKFLTVAEMKVLLRSRGLRAGGVKQVLSERLAQCLAVV